MKGAVEAVLREIVSDGPRPSDWVYVQNFPEPHKPIAVDLSPGCAPRFRDGMRELIDDLKVALPAAFRSEEYQTRRAAVDTGFQKKQGEPLAQLQAEASAKEITILRRGPRQSRWAQPTLARSPRNHSFPRANFPSTLSAISEADRLLAHPRIQPVSNGSNQRRSAGKIGMSDASRCMTDNLLQRLLRDPLGFVWRYALGWNAPQEYEEPLSITLDDLGKLVHELLRRAVDSLEPDPGYAKASEAQIEAALSGAATVVRESWPSERPVPPKLLWSNTIDYAAAMALVGLLRKDITDEGTRSWTEVPFGQPNGFMVGRSFPGIQQSPWLYGHADSVAGHN